MKDTRSEVAAKIESMAKDLEGEEARLKDRLAELDEERTAIQGQLEYIQNVRAAMKGEVAPGAKTGRRKRGTGGSGLKRAEIRDLVTQELKERGEVKFADLQKRVEEEAKRNGKSNRGIAVQIRGVVLGDGFSVANREGSENEAAAEWRVKLAQSASRT